MGKKVCVSIARLEGFFPVRTKSTKSRLSRLLPLLLRLINANSNHSFGVLLLSDGMIIDSTLPFDETLSAVGVVETVSDMGKATKTN